MDQLFNSDEFVKHYFSHDYKTEPKRQKELRFSEKYRISWVYTNYGTRENIMSSKYAIPWQMSWESWTPERLLEGKWNIA